MSKPINNIDSELILFFDNYFNITLTDNELRDIKKFMLEILIRQLQEQLHLIN